MRYLVGYEIVGHMVVEASNPQAAAAMVGGQVRGAARSLEDSGENEYRAPFGDVIEVGDKSAGPFRRHRRS